MSAVRVRASGGSGGFDCRVERKQLIVYKGMSWLGMRLFCGVGEGEVWKELVGEVGRGGGREGGGGGT